MPLGYNVIHMAENWAIMLGFGPQGWNFEPKAKILSWNLGLWLGFGVILTMRLGFDLGM